MKFSIIIPTYKGLDTLSIAIQSVLTQSFNDYEIIVSDDNEIGSNEQIETEKIVNDFKKTNLNLVYLKNGHHNGSYARNRGIEIAKGDYISFLDDDDYYMENYLYEVNNCIHNKQIDIIFCDVLVVNDKKPAKLVTNKSIDSKKLLFGESEIGTGSNICFKNTRKEQFDERYERHQDIEFVSKFLQNNNYFWINKVEIIKYFNGNDNYPNVEKALKVQKLLREDMENKHIIESDDIIKLQNYELHALYNDLLVKNAPKSEIEKIIYLLMENNIYSNKDKIASSIYFISKSIFNFMINVYLLFKHKKIDKEFYRAAINRRNSLIEMSK